MSLPAILTIVGVSITAVFAIYATRVYLYTGIALRSRSKPDDPPPDEQAFVQVLIPIFNEKPRVVNRILTACSSLDYSSYEVVVADDSDNSETLAELSNWKFHDKIRIVHRENREGWKGGALRNCMNHLNPRTSHVLVFDADFVPPPDIVERMLSYFSGRQIAAVQGYQLHVLNANQNWITKAIRVMFSMGYMIDLVARMRLGSWIPLGGSVMMIRRQPMEEAGGFGPELSEDLDLCVRLYLKGYKVIYVEDLRVPAECPCTVRRSIRQQMRWSEGTTRIYARYVGRILKSPFMSVREKLEFAFHAGMYIQAILFVVANLLLVALVVSQGGRLGSLALLISPFVAYLALSTPLAMLAGLYREGASRSGKWVPYSLALGYVMMPFMAYAALKGLFRRDGFWHRTPKTGLVTTQSAVFPAS